MDEHPDTSADARWATYAEIARARGISRGSAERLARRHKWRKQLGNDQIIRLLVPTDMMVVSEGAPADASADMPADSDRDALAQMAVEYGRAVEALRAAMTAIEARAVRAETQADTERTRADAERTRADSERRRAEGLEADLERVSADTDRLRVALEKADAALAEVRRPAWRRWLGLP